MKYTKRFFWLLFFLQKAFMMASLPPQLESLIQQLPEYRQHQYSYQVKKIEGGLTNHNFQVIFPKQTYFVRLTKKNGWLIGLNFEREILCAQAAAELGIAPNVVLYSLKDRAIVFQFIDGSPPEKNRDSYERLLTTLRTLHQSEVIFPTHFCPYRAIEVYYSQALNLREGQNVPRSDEILAVVEEIRAVIPKLRTTVPCHLDLYNLNFLDDGQNIWIVDWEYSAMADPIFDLATLISSDRLSINQMEELLELYLECPKTEDYAYLFLLCILADIRWWLWNYIQAEVSEIPAPYLEFADYSLEQILQKATHPYYLQSLHLLRR